MVTREYSVPRIVDLRKLLRFVALYGVRRTAFKALARIRVGPRLLSRSRSADVGVIGCGQFAFATVGYFLWARFGKKFCACFDQDAEAQRSFSRFFGCSGAASNSMDIIRDPQVRVVYITSNHASHTPYALQVLEAAKTAYVEKPICVSFEQLRQIARAVRAMRPGARIYAGYNRPFSRAVKLLRDHCDGQKGPVTITCHVSAHAIDEAHWYRKPEEGSRICGNFGHWLDLAVHILAWRNLPDRWTLSVLPSDPSSPDDNLAVCMSSDYGDLVTIVMTSRSEPFEGINETINFQQGSVIAKIDDFRSMTVWKDANVWRRRFRPKDVGHRDAILQPFGGWTRDWREVELSTLLMLTVREMVASSCYQRPFSFADAWASLGVPDAGDMVREA